MYSQVKDTLSVSALELTKQEVTYNSAHPFYLKSTSRFYSSTTHKPVFVVGMI